MAHVFRPIAEPSERETMPSRMVFYSQLLKHNTVAGVNSNSLSTFWSLVNKQMVALSNVWNLFPAHADTTLHQHHMTVRPDCGAQTNHNHLGSSPVTCLTSMYEKVLLYCRINKMCNSGAIWFSWINCLQFGQLDDVRPEKKNSDLTELFKALLQAISLTVA